jgi:uncharacterized protein YdaU (DUF1376 family)
MTTDWCADCEKPLERLEHGDYRLCCRGRYWSTREPSPRDRLVPIIRARGTVTGVLVTLYEPVYRTKMVIL